MPLLLDVTWPRKYEEEEKKHSREKSNTASTAAWPTWFKYYQTATVDVICCSRRVVAMARHTTATHLQHTIYGRGSPAGGWL